MRFSQRQGISPVEKAIQRESIDDELKNSIWSLLQLFYWDEYDKDRHSMYGRGDYIKGSNMQPLITKLWLHYYKKPIDTIHESFWDCVEYLRDYFFCAFLRLLLPPYFIDFVFYLFLKNFNKLLVCFHKLSLGFNLCDGHFLSF